MICLVHAAHTEQRSFFSVSLSGPTSVPFTARIERPPVVAKKQSALSDQLSVSDQALSLTAEC
jgi:hypothetical protein